jgi:hypothetical protein
LISSGCGTAGRDDEALDAQHSIRGRPLATAATTKYCATQHVTKSVSVTEWHFVHTSAVVSNLALKQATARGVVPTAPSTLTIANAVAAVSGVTHFLRGGSQGVVPVIDRGSLQ